MSAYVVQDLAPRGRCPVCCDNHLLRALTLTEIGEAVVTTDEQRFVLDPHVNAETAEECEGSGKGPVSFEFRRPAP